MTRESGSVPHQEPPRALGLEEYWERFDDGRFATTRCDVCGEWAWPPRGHCPLCGSAAVAWTDLSGDGTVYSKTVVRRGQGEWADQVPYVVAVIELTEGPHVLANVVGPGALDISIGDPVRVDVGGDAGVPTFVPASAA